MADLDRQDLIKKALEVGIKNAKFLSDAKLIQAIAKAEGRELTDVEKAKVEPKDAGRTFIPTNLKKMQTYKVKVKMVETGEEKIVPIKEYSEAEAIERAKKISDGLFEVTGVESKVKKDVEAKEGTKIFTLKGKKGDVEVKIEVATKDLDEAIAFTTGLGLSDVTGDQKYKATGDGKPLECKVNLDGRTKTEWIKDYLRTGNYTLKGICEELGCRPTQVYTSKKQMEEKGETVPPMKKG